MKGGNSFGINSASFGNIIIALNMFKYYIKVDYIDGTENETNNGIYYFIFELTGKNGIVTQLGLNASIIQNGNLDISMSKTLLDLQLNRDIYECTLVGKAYKKNGKSSDLTFIEDSGINAELKIRTQNNAFPKFILVLKPESEDHNPKFPGAFDRTGSTTRELPLRENNEITFVSNNQDNTLDSWSEPDQNDMKEEIVKMIDNNKKLVSNYRENQSDIDKEALVDNQVKLLTLLCDRKFNLEDNDLLIYLFTILENEKNFILNLNDDDKSAMLYVRAIKSIRKLINDKIEHKKIDPKIIEEQKKEEGEKQKKKDEEEEEKQREEEEKQREESKKQREESKKQREEQKK
jgi:hypothetical protein